jgi:predicted DNA-binding transcriptional regulator AlpA
MSQTEAPPIEVLGVADIAKRLGISRQAVDEASRRPGFPEPYAIVESRRRFWRPDDIEAYMRGPGRRPGRQWKSNNNGGGP